MKPAPQLRSVSIRVPASTSNLGAGFDTLGFALDLHNTVRLVRGVRPGVAAADAASRPGTAMAAEAAELFFKRTGAPSFGFKFSIRGRVPMSRGLGSSVTLRAGVVAGLNALAGAKLTRREIAALVHTLEGHPDNAAPAALGGFCVGRTDPQTGELAGVVRRAIGRGLVFVVASPRQQVQTKQSRGVLPRRLPYFDAVKSINSASYVTAAFLTGEFERLAHAVADFMHEPYRLPRIPGARDAIVAGVAAGALTGWLSGSGSSVLCVARPARAAKVGRAMSGAFAQTGVRCRVVRLQADNLGLQVVARGR
ncbi:MAG: homoserine kinase [Opitutus sp.]|nr:homoserine kinase [Opitutus sp.]